MKYFDRVQAQIDLNAITYNLKNMKANIAPRTKIMGIIKTDGYGHGAIPIAKTMEPIDYVFGFGVATADEAIELREAGIKKPILILGYTFPESYQELIMQEIRPAIFTEDMLYNYDTLAEKMHKKCKIHIKVDTGMSRIGILPNEEGLQFVKKAAACKNIEIEGIFTHFAKADETDKTSVNLQIECFKNFTTMIQKELGIMIPIKHCSNSAGIVELSAANMDMVRAGITLYGLWPSDEVRQDIVDLKPVLTLKSKVVYVKTIQPGTAVSYGGTYIADEPVRIATVSIGYGDGYPRSLSNKGYVLIHGQRAPIVGRVCMDQLMIDVTKIEGEVKVLDTVTLIGKDGNEEITMETLGKLSGRFNYELACDIGKRVPRIYI